MSLRRRKVAYFGLRAACLVAFLIAAFVMPRGGAAGAVVLVAGAVAVLAGIGVNAGGPGERSGARTTSDYFNSISPPQGEWPPFDPDRVVDGEVAPPEARRPTD